MPATLTRPADLARQLDRLTRLLADDGFLLTVEAERELGLLDPAHSTPTLAGVHPGNPGRMRRLNLAGIAGRWTTGTRGESSG